MNILIVEEKEKLADSIMDGIKKQIKNCSITKTNSGEAALRLIDEEVKFDIFILDVYLPRYSGLKIAEYIRNKKEHYLTPIIFMGDDVRRELVVFQQFQCYAFLEKPFKLDTLIEKVFKIKEGIIGDQKEYRIFETKKSNRRIALDELLFIEYESRACYLHTANDKIELKSMTLKELEEHLPLNFKRSHKSFIINTDNIMEIKLNKQCAHVTKFMNTKKKAFIGKRYFLEINETQKGEYIKSNANNDCLVIT